jgi:hypothetical protein
VYVSDDGSTPLLAAPSKLWQLTRDVIRERPVKQ